MMAGWPRLLHRAAPPRSVRRRRAAAGLADEPDPRHSARTPVGAVVPGLRLGAVCVGAIPTTRRRSPANSTSPSRCSGSPSAGPTVSGPPPRAVRRAARRRRHRRLRRAAARLQPPLRPRRRLDRPGAATLGGAGQARRTRPDPRGT